MIGTTAALIMGGLAAGSHLAAAKVQSNAAKNAAKTQEQAGQQSIALQRQGYEDAKTNLAPWMATGQNAMGALTSRLGVSPGQPMPVGSGQTPAAAGAMPRLQAPQGSANLAVFNRSPAASPPASQPGPGSSTVRLRAPNGDEMDVPAARAGFYMSKGAARV